MRRGRFHAAAVVLGLALGWLLPTVAAGYRNTHRPHDGKHAHRRASRKPSRLPAGALLGNSSVGSHHNSVVAGRSRAFRFRAVAPGLVAEAHVYVDRRSTASSLIVGIYSNARGRPSRLLSTGSTDSLLPGAWNLVRLREVGLREGKVYWLAVLGEGGVLRYREAQPRQCLGQTISQSQLPALPASWGLGKVERSCPLSAYVTLSSKASPVEVTTQPFVAPLPAGSPGEAAPPLTSPPVPPENLALPTISGTLMKGEVLTSSEGEWTGNPTSYAYQWQDCAANGQGCADVEGANEGEYRLGSADVGHTLRVIVTAADTSGDASAGSLPTGVVEEPPPSAPSNTALPTISGEAVEGEVLSADEGEWTESPTSYSYQWQRCNTMGSDCSNVSGATHSTYSLGSGDVGHTLRVVVKATNAGGTGSADSDLTQEVEKPSIPPPTAPQNTSLPMISGTATLGQVLSANVGSWSGSPTSYSYQWQRCTASSSCSSVSGATAQTYTLGSTDAKHEMRVVVKATNAGGTGSANSALTAEVNEPTLSAPKNTTLPTISGTAISGHVLSAAVGSWSGSPTSYAYQWQRCNAEGKECSNVTGVIGSAYSLGSGDVNHTLRVVVSAKNAGGTGSATSAVSAVVTAPAPAAPTNSSLPTISGSTIEGSALSASKGTWTGSPTSYAYQWERCDTTGGSCSSVGGATGTSYSLVASDVGHTVRVVVRASNGGGATSATSAQTATVTALTGQQAHCFRAPGACGYPDPNYGNVGATSPCSSLASSDKEITVSTAGATVENMNITGGVNIAAKNVTLTNDCITLNGQGSGDSSIVDIGNGDTGTQITHSSISGANSTTQSVEEALNNNYSNPNTIADHDYIYNCGECVHGTWTLTNSYVTSNANISGAHYEDIYCSDATSLIEHNVLINPHEQTANIFCNTGGGDGGAADNHLTITNNLFAGAGYSLYPQGNATSIGTSTMKVVGNRFARCLSTPITDSEGDVTCSGGADENGYWPRGGYYGIDAYTYCPPAAGQEWSNNVWDDNNESVGC
jgi:hypothetical protein